jgi:hypothetical protein
MPTPTPEEVARVRRESKRNEPNSTWEADLIGAMGEIAFAKAFGFEVDMTPRPDGDGGVDFVFWRKGKRKTIDVKTANRAPYLLVTERTMRKCADIVVLGAHDRGEVTFIGWEVKGVMSTMPTADFGLGPNNLSHFRAASELRPMGQLVNYLGGASVSRERPQPDETENEL